MVERVLAVTKGAEGRPGTGVFWVLQNPGSALQFDRAMVFEDGTVAEQGTPQELRQAGGKLVELIEQS